MADTVTVVFAVYGALKPEYGHFKAECRDVKNILQTLLDQSSNKVVEINNTTMGGDPADGVVKHFAAIVEYNNTERRPYACQENQTIDFH
jgi:hypothetical protein